MEHLREALSRLIRDLGQVAAGLGRDGALDRGGQSSFAEWCEEDDVRMLGGKSLHAADLLARVAVSIDVQEPLQLTGVLELVVDGDIEHLAPAVDRSLRDIPDH